MSEVNPSCHKSHKKDYVKRFDLSEHNNFWAGPKLFGFTLGGTCP